ncbi:MAG: multidrug efflux SMR transporter [Candidatus Binatus sp.]|jgi:quaternary ammonium compound-resistance protein SugE|uniref:DMT family transporter n=1 Tax=Candidatus Binatus sp. TaxID=2811406 RepID=UPI003BAE3961
MDWLALVMGGVMEIGFALGMKYNAGFTRLWPSLGTAVQVCLSLYLLSFAMKSIPIGTAYVVWTGIGSVGTVAIGVLWFGESTDTLRLSCVGLIIAGSLGLNLIAPH